MNVDVIPFERFDERLGHAIGLRAAHRCEAGNEPEADGEVDGLLRAITAAIVREPLQRVRCSSGAEATLQTLEHQVADHLATDTAGRCTPGHDLAVARVQREGHADHLAVPAGDLQAVRGPTQVGPDRDDLAFVGAAGRFAGVALQQQSVLRHESVDV